MPWPTVSRGVTRDEVIFMRHGIWASALLMMVLTGCVGAMSTDAPAADEDPATPPRSLPNDPARFEGAQAKSGETCGGACGEGYYTACTCGVDDPCGWSADNICDDTCQQLLPRPFDDGDDCPTSDCAVTICLTGAINQRSAANAVFGEICERAEIPGLVRDCDRSPCYSTFNNFLQSLNWEIYPQLFYALDTNDDGAVDGDDQACEVNIIGFSWGGVNAVELASKFISDGDVSDGRAFVDRLIILDPYQPLAGRGMEIPWRVRRTRTFRHTQPPDEDCSTWSPLGPYTGLAPRCYADADCVDYDYSLDPSASYPTYTGGALAGDEVGHCSILRVAHEPVISEILDQPYDGPLPPTVPIKPR